MDVTVAVASFGGRHWQELAESRAVPSALQQAPVVRVHGETLHGARNDALARVKSEFVIHLDADDELESGYVEAMAAGSADLRAPAVRYVRGTTGREPYVPRVAGHRHECVAGCIASGAGNWLVVGTMARAALLREAGGWRDWPLYEDFDLWMRAIRRGASVEAIPAAVYRAHVNQQSRNRAPSMRYKNQIHHEIVASVLGPHEAAA